MTKAVIVREQESELPALVTIDFINLNADHERGSQSARRSSVNSEQRAQISLPIVFPDKEVRNIAERMIYSAWTSRNSFSMRLPPQYSYLEPTDVFDLVDEEQSLQHTIRIIKSTKARSGAIEIECVAEFAAVYIQTVATGAATVIPQTPVISSQTNIAIMDIPALRDGDNSSGFYIAMSGATDVWGGGAVYTSVDNGASYTLTDSTVTPAVMGTATKLSDWTGGNTIDESSTMILTPMVGTLSSIDMTALLNGGNLLALQSGDGWELLQYRRAVLQADGHYALSGFLRGRYGTEWAMSGHRNGDKFVVMDTATVRRVSVTSSLIGVPMLVKALGLGQPLGAVAPISVTNSGIALKPYSPSILGGGRNADGSVVLKWIRRTRVGGAWINNSDVPLSEASELYDVEIYDASYTTVIRSIRVDTPTLTYSAADQISDFGSLQAKIYFKVFQVSATVGRGYEAKGAI